MLSVIRVTANETVLHEPQGLPGSENCRPQRTLSCSGWARKMGSGVFGGAEYPQVGKLPPAKTPGAIRIKNPCRTACRQLARSCSRQEPGRASRKCIPSESACTD